MGVDEPFAEEIAMLAAHKRLEEICEQQQLFYRKTEEAHISVIATGRYPEHSHQITLGLAQNGKVGVFVTFPPCDKKDIRNVWEFCEELGSRLGSEASVGFDDAEGYFFLYDTVVPDKLASYLAVLARDCDILKPLCESVGKMGNWHCALYMGFASPEDVEHWPRV